VYENIRFEVEGPVATLTLNRPRAMNAITAELDHELHSALDEADNNRSVRAVILTGSGKAFSAGYDMGEERDQVPSESAVSSGEASEEGGKDYISYWYRQDKLAIEKLMHFWQLRIPIIAAVNGWAMGGGFWYQLAADITIASENAVFAQPEVRHIGNTSFLFTALCGWKAANRYALTGDHFDAKEAHRIGLVNEVVPAGELMARARQIANRISLVPEASIRINKAISMMGLQASGIYSGMMLNGALSAIVHSSYGPERERLMEAGKSGGLRGFLEARDAPFAPEPFGPRSRKD
jgi:enoyl-CoA hydratase/carnithine racemase